MNASIIIPCYNEEAHIEAVLEAILDQTYPRSNLEVIISDGLSTDGTRAVIARFMDQNPSLKVLLVDNPQRTIPAGLNQALAAASGNYILRMDAHSVPAADYVERCLAALKAGLGANVGGVIDIQAAAAGWIPESIAVAAGHPLGVGDARYRTGSEARQVDTVAFGAYRSNLIQEIGGYDESLLANEDYEFNVRVRKSGGVVWLDPAIKVKYFARSSLAGLARQYWRYGYWKLRMLLRYPETLRWRQLSGLFVLSWILLVVLAVWFPIARWALFLEALIYGSALILAGIKSAWEGQKIYLVAGLPLAIATMHFSWGGGFLWSAITATFDKILPGQAPGSL